MKSEGEESEDVEIRDIETNEKISWSDIFFNLHKHCNLNKWEIWEYTLPQITELMMCINRYIQFEVETRLTPFSIFGGGASKEESEQGDTEDGYREATEDDIMELARILGGG